MKNLELNKEEKRKITQLLTKPFDKLSKKDQKVVLTLGAKDFRKRFSTVIKELART